MVVGARFAVGGVGLLDQRARAGFPPASGQSEIYRKRLDICFRMWGRLATCGGLAIRLFGSQLPWCQQRDSSVCGARPIGNRPQVANLPPSEY